MTFIEEVKQATENLITLISGFDNRVEQLDKDKKVLDAFDFRLREREKDLNDKESVLIKKEEEQVQEKNWISKKMVELKNREFEITQLENELKDRAKIIKVLDQKKAELDILQKETDKKIEEKDKVEKTKEENEKERYRLDRDTQILNDKKQIINKDKQFVEAERVRLQKIANYFGTKVK